MKFDWRDIDLTEELKDAGVIVAQEIRGSIKRGESASDGVSLPLNKPSTAKQKVKRSGESKPLVDKYKSLITPNNYKVESDRFKASITLTDMVHPSGNATVSQIGAWNHYGTEKTVPRPFFAITELAKKRIIAMIARKIREVVSGRKG
jgi:hypothetical protein